MLSLDFILHTLNSIQRKWVYLEPIFARGTLSYNKDMYDSIVCCFHNRMRHSSALAQYLTVNVLLFLL